jgi:hypothetical protein
MIHLLWCTIRPNQFLLTHEQWMLRATNTSNVKTYVCVNTESEAQIIKQKLNVDIKISDKPDRIGVCYPSYILSSSLEGKDDDIVVFASDDFLPPQDWDNYLINKFKGRKGVSMVRDGYQAPDSSNMLHPAVTIPLMTYSALVEMNKVIYHPAYNHMFSDCELYMTAKDLDLLIDERLQDETIFEHHHWAAGKRNADVADQGYHSKWKNDEVVWNIRKNLNVEERIKV